MKKTYTDLMIEALHLAAKRGITEMDGLNKVIAEVFKRYDG